MLNEKLLNMVILLGSGFNCLSTYIIAKKFKGREQNPFLRMLMNNFGLKVLVIWFPIEVVLIYLILRISEVFTGNIVLRMTIILAPWIAGSMNVYQYILLSKKHN